MERGKGTVIEWVSGKGRCDIPGCRTIAHSMLVISGSPDRVLASRCPIHCGEMTMKAIRRRWNGILNGHRNDGKTFQKGQNGGPTARQR